jgi:hypothetical protein
MTRITTNTYPSTFIITKSISDHKTLYTGFNSFSMVNTLSPPQSLPIMIIGAGISGLLLAQQLRKSNLAYQVYERDSNFSTRGVGWGLTLHWSLPALRQLLPKELFVELPNTYVDRAAVERGESSTFPFYDLSTGELRSQSPKAVESQRIRVTRERLRNLLATDIDIKVYNLIRDSCLLISLLRKRTVGKDFCRLP